MKLEGDQLEEAEEALAKFREWTMSSGDMASVAVDLTHALGGGYLTVKKLMEHLYAADAAWSKLAQLAHSRGVKDR